MSTLVMTCPHCGAQKMTFTPVSQSGVPGRPNFWIVYAMCSGCHKPVSIEFNGPHGANPGQHQGDLMHDSPFQCLGIHPKPTPTDIPEDVPENVAKAFKQGAESRKAGHLDAACGMYRRAMELALKTFSPDIEAWKLEKRIDKMASEGRITAEIQTWAHELRLDGNDALHGDDEATPEMAEQMHSLCKFLLIYLYTLPAQVAAAKARRDGAAN